jgi:hypothetical protein
MTVPETPPVVKPWYLSKTVWVGLLTLLVGVLPIVAEYLKILTPDQAAPIAAFVTMALGVLGIVIRSLADGTTPTAKIK